MLAILNSLNAHNLPIFQPILMILVSKFMVYRALFDKTYLSLGLQSPFIYRQIDHLCIFCLVFAMHLYASVYMCLMVTC